MKANLAQFLCQSGGARFQVALAGVGNLAEKLGAGRRFDDLRASTRFDHDRGSNSHQELLALKIARILVLFLHLGILISLIVFALLLLNSQIVAVLWVVSSSRLFSSWSDRI